MDGTGRELKEPTGTPLVPRQPGRVTGDDSTGPILAGDTVEGRPVVGFACTATGLPTAADDQLVLEGDEGSGPPPRRSTDPAAQPSLSRTGRAPHEQIGPALSRDPEAVCPGSTSRFEELLYGPSSLVCTMPLIEQLAASGHHSWLSGGTPRDLLSGADPADVNDVDLTGTAPAGAFTDTARAVLDLDGISAEHVQRFNPWTLTCGILDPVDRTHGPTLDYRGLGVPRDVARFRMTGSDLLQDARQRDLTVNTLLYDPLLNVVVDPLGDALDDLGYAAPQGTRRLVPALVSQDPMASAEVLLRGVKFLLRWQGHPGGLDDEPLRAWALALPDDLPDRIDACGPEAWHHLRALLEQCLPHPASPAVLETVHRLGGVAVRVYARCATEAV
ncbi:hypothetical protein ACQPXS_45605 [Streptomyces sp. CA-142005]|uniref:hypothetical protein n=1 Tax=Streptomyces sp. CA-142005 TaxID=3240052 RepID=UPI003D8B617B